MRCFFNGAEKYKIYATDLAINLQDYETTSQQDNWETRCLGDLMTLSKNLCEIL